MWPMATTTKYRHMWQASFLRDMTPPKVSQLTLTITYYNMPSRVARRHHWTATRIFRLLRSKILKKVSCTVIIQSESSSVLTFENFSPPLIPDPASPIQSKHAVHIMTTWPSPAASCVCVSVCVCKSECVRGRGCVCVCVCVHERERERKRERERCTCTMHAIS